MKPKKSKYILEKELERKIKSHDFSTEDDIPEFDEL